MMEMHVGVDSQEQGSTHLHAGALLQVTLISNKKCVLGLPPVFNTELLKVLGFPVMRATNVSYVNEVTFGST